VQTKGHVNSERLYDEPSTSGNAKKGIAMVLSNWLQIEMRGGTY